jgi:YfiH family protein
VLLADGDGRVIGAAHAGWKGALAGVTDAVVEAMIDLGAARSKIRAVVGPCIAQESYEVGPEFPDPFIEEDPGNKRFFKSAERDGHFMFDLDDYVHMRLADAGIFIVQSMSLDTLADDKKFYSYRRATHRAEPDYGRQLSAITISPALH